MAGYFYYPALPRGHAKDACAGRPMPGAGDGLAQIGETNPQAAVFGLRQRCQAPLAFAARGPGFAQHAPRIAAGLRFRQVEESKSRIQSGFHQVGTNRNPLTGPLCTRHTAFLMGTILYHERYCSIESRSANRVAARR